MFQSVKLHQDLSVVHRSLRELASVQVHGTFNLMFIFTLMP